jgi:hypothetical protein
MTAPRRSHRRKSSARGRAEKRADRTKIAHLDEDGATFTAVCFDHGPYEAHVDPEDDQPYPDLAILYRNLVKERALGRDTDVLHVMMKGGHWVFGCQLVDGALGALDTPPARMPVRVFTRRCPRARQHSPDLSAERETLGVLAIGIELVDPPRPTRFVVGAGCLRISEPGRRPGRRRCRRAGRVGRRARRRSRR